MDVLLEDIHLEDIYPLRPHHSLLRPVHGIRILFIHRKLHSPLHKKGQKGGHCRRPGIRGNDTDGRHCRPHVRMEAHCSQGNGNPVRTSSGVIPGIPYRPDFRPAHRHIQLCPGKGSGNRGQNQCSQAGSHSLHRRYNQHISGRTPPVYRGAGQAGGTGRSLCHNGQPRLLRLCRLYP